MATSGMDSGPAFADGETFKPAIAFVGGLDGPASYAGGGAEDGPALAPFRCGALSPKIHWRTAISIFSGSFGNLPVSRFLEQWCIGTHLSTPNFGIHRSPSMRWKNRGSGAASPAASRFRASSRCLSSTAVFALVAPCMSDRLIASVSLPHSLIVSPGWRLSASRLPSRFVLLLLCLWQYALLS